MNQILSMSEPLDSRQLRAFVTLAKTGSFTRTGKDLWFLAVFSGWRVLA